MSSFICCDCGDSEFVTEDALRSHIAVCHLGAFVPFECGTCLELSNTLPNKSRAQFPTRHKMAQHILRRHKDKLNAEVIDSSYNDPRTKELEHKVTQSKNLDKGTPLVEKAVPLGSTTRARTPAPVTTSVQRYSGQQSGHEPKTIAVSSVPSGVSVGGSSHTLLRTAKIEPISPTRKEKPVSKTKNADECLQCLDVFGRGSLLQPPSFPRQEDKTHHVLTHHKKFGFNFEDCFPLALATPPEKEKEQDADSSIEILEPEPPQIVQPDSTPNYKRPTHKCRVCFEDIKFICKAQHIFEKHIKPKAVGCSYCNYKCHYNVSYIRCHQRKIHPDQKLRIIDRRKHYKEQYEEWREKCFGDMARSEQGPGGKMDWLS